MDRNTFEKHGNDGNIFVVWRVQKPSFFFRQKIFKENMTGHGQTCDLNGRCNDGPVVFLVMAVVGWSERLSFFSPLAWVPAWVLVGCLLGKNVKSKNAYIFGWLLDRDICYCEFSPLASVQP